MNNVVHYTKKKKLRQFVKFNTHYSERGGRVTRV